VRALQVSRNGRPTETPEIVDLDVPEPGPGQVRIAASAGALNFNDLDRCYGRVRA
jgi:NADPH:quinone reductase